MAFVNRSRLLLSVACRHGNNQHLFVRECISWEYLIGNTMRIQAYSAAALNADLEAGPSAATIAHPYYRVMSDDAVS